MKRADLQSLLKLLKSNGVRRYRDEDVFLEFHMEQLPVADASGLPAPAEPEESDEDLRLWSTPFYKNPTGEPPGGPT